MSNALNFENIVTNWKSSVQGILTVSIAIGTYFTVTPSSLIDQKTVGIITLIVGVAKVLLGFIQKDS